MCSSECRAGCSKLYPSSELELVRIAVALGAAGGSTGALSPAEQALVDASLSIPPAPVVVVDAARADIADGSDPLGEQFSILRSATERRDQGAFYTPTELVEPMVVWTMKNRPARVVDAGAGSGRFAVAVARQLPGVEIVAVDLDPLATLMARAHLASAGATNATVLQVDYTTLTLPPVEGVTAWIGNPPYVRHHGLPETTKAWAKVTAKKLGMTISGLAGLHAHFFLATATFAQPGDVGCFVTSAEWLDVNYGAIVRNLLVGALGGESIHVMSPESLPFQSVQTTAAITTFRVGSTESHLRLRTVEKVAEIAPLESAGLPISRERLNEAPRWSVFLRPHQQHPEGYIELGELCRVHRGAVTGANSTWVVQHAANLPESVLYASITRARELFAARTALTDDSVLRRVADIPAELDELEASDRKQVDRFLRQAKKAGVDRGYIAAHRKRWWAVGLKAPAPILATYMARQPPAFVLNSVDARHINIAHGLYPRAPLDARTTQRLAEALRLSVARGQSRVYAGGLMKWEPKEMERLTVPDLDMLQSYDDLSQAMVP